MTGRRPSVCLRIAAGALAVLGAAVGASAGDWTLKPGAGYVHAKTGEARTASGLLDLAEERVKTGRTSEAIELFATLSETSEDEEIRRKAYRRRSDVEFQTRQYVSAYRTCEAYLTRYPQAEDLPEKVKREMECARLLSEFGSEEKVIGLFTTRTARPGIDLLRKILERYPFEEFSDDYHYVLGDLLFRINDLDGAAAEFELLMKNYPQSEWSPAALFGLGLLSLTRFDAAPYDGKPLKEARRRLRQYVESYPSGREIELVRRKIHDLDELEAQRAFRIADYYVGQGRIPSARFYFTYIATEYPGTFWSSEAALRLKEMGGSPR